MDIITKIITGGFLGKYRTYVLAAALVVNVVAAYLVGDANLVDTIKNHWEEIAIAFGLVSAHTGNDIVNKPAAPATPAA